MSFFAAFKGHRRSCSLACKPEISRVPVIVLVSLLVLAIASDAYGNCAFSQTGDCVEGTHDPDDHVARFGVSDSVSIYGNTIDAFDAAGRTVSNARRQIRERRVIDAFWYLGAENFYYSKENAARSAQETSLINTTGQVSTTVYGGPAGAAAYAAWYAYRVTGNFEMALRVGLIAGTRRAAISDAEAKLTEQLAQKAMIAGAVGGVAVAAGGGDVNALVEGFLKSGGVVLVQDGYKNYTENDQDARQSIPEAYCIMADTEMSHDPSQSDSCLLSADADTDWLHERGSFMTTVSDVSRLHEMTGFRDHWAVSWNMSALSTEGPQVPAVVITYMGTTAPLEKLSIDDTVLDNTDSLAVARQLKLLALQGVEGRGSIRLAEYSCDYAGMSRNIAVDKGGERTDYACRVVYDTEKEMSVLWSARTDAGYCGPKAVSVIDNLLEGGWSCLSRELQADDEYSVTASSENPFVPETKLSDLQNDPQPDEQVEQQPEEQKTSRPDRQYPISSLYECYKGGAVRTVYVEHGNSDEAFTCRVVYESEEDSTIPWSAQNDWKNCGPMAIALARKFQDYGWSCS